MAIKLDEAINLAFNNLKQHFWLLTKLGLLLYVLPTFIINVLGSVLAPMLLAGFTTGDPSSAPSLSLGILGAGFVVLIVIVVIISLFQLLFSVTAINVLNEKRQGNELGIGEAIRKGFSSYGAAIISSLLVGIFLLFLYLLFIIPGVIFSIYWTFILYAIVIDKKGPAEALGYSKKLVKGDWWGVFGVLLIFGLISWSVSFLVGLFTLPLLFIPIVGAFANDIIMSIVTLLFLIFTISILEAIYIKLGEQKLSSQASDGGSSSSQEPRQVVYPSQIPNSGQPQTMQQQDEPPELRL